jgi:acetyltransferase-like isoleucine patch superfamily enzyme
MPPHRVPPQQAPNPLGGPKEKEKMLAGELYMPYCNELTADRESCRANLDNFTRASTYTGIPISKEQRTRLMHLVFDPQDQQNRVTGNSPNTRVGRGVYIDIPFRCDYGYNIAIGDDVSIESGCFISDPREVIIGANTMIGPDVKIMGKQYPYNPADRRGALSGKARGYKIIIGEGVCIGAGCIISPGEETCKDGVLQIGAGAYIPDGTVVTKVMPFISMFRAMANRYDRMSQNTPYSA